MPPSIVVLEALLIGLEVEIPYIGRKFKVRLKDNVLVYDVVVETFNNKTGENSSEVMEARLDLPLDLFVRSCNSMSDRELLEIGADVALNLLNESKRHDNKS